MKRFEQFKVICVLGVVMLVSAWYLQSSVGHVKTYLHLSTTTQGPSVGHVKTYLQSSTTTQGSTVGHVKTYLQSSATTQGTTVRHVKTYLQSSTTTQGTTVGTPLHGGNSDPKAIDIQSLKGIRFKSDIDMSKTDPKKGPNALTSVVKLRSNKTEFRLGETIQVVIQLFDSYKQRKTTGGDFVRVLMREVSKNASAAGSVTDNNDGTYTGSLKALWTGSPQIEVEVVGSKETMKIYNRSFHEHDTSRFFSMLFERKGVKQVTRCVPGPLVPGFRFVCNLTADNDGLPWYCGKPSTRSLSCSDHRGFLVTGYRPVHFPPHEKRFLHKTLLHQTIPRLLKINVSSAETFVSLPSTPCNKSPLRQSWEASTPVGFFYKNQWKSLTCNNTIRHDPQIYLKCLKDRTLWIHGDSTSRYWFMSLFDHLGMKFVSSVSQASIRKKWNKHMKMRSEDWNASVVFLPHGYPYYHGPELRTHDEFRGSHIYLDDLPSHSRDIFVIHIYLHFLSSGPELFRSHMRKIVQSVKSLVSRAPDIKLAVRGAHAFKSLYSTGFMDDIFMLTFDKILKEEFREVQDNVLYINSEDITIVNEVEDVHPPPLVLNALINHLMGYVCK